MTLAKADDQILGNLPRGAPWSVMIESQQNTSDYGLAKRRATQALVQCIRRTIKDRNANTFEVDTWLTFTQYGDILPDAVRSRYECRSCHVDMQRSLSLSMVISHLARRKQVHARFKCKKMFVSQGTAVWSSGSRKRGRPNDLGDSAGAG